jgi:hypothetical protein
MGTRLSLQSAAVALLVFASPWLRASPYTPASDDVVVERLPSRLMGAAERQEERRQRALLRQQPASVPLALRSAREAIDRARQLGDPRELGQAQAALAPWWAQPDPPAPVRLMRAIIRQSQHDFAGSLADLDALLAPGREVPLGVRAQAELTRATVLQVTGRWADAAAGCERLQGPAYAALGDAVRVPAQVCRAELYSLQGREQEADRLLQPLVRAAGTGDAWMTLVRAERADRRGQPEAGALYRQALAAHTDVYTLAAYADWLLARQQPAEAARLLAGREEADALLLRLAIAWQRTGDARAAAATATLAERFAASAARGDTGHEREQALFALHLAHDKPRALVLARENWQRQKEPVDALLLLAAAQAAGQPAAAEPVREFAQANGWVDRRLAALNLRTGHGQTVHTAWRKP